MSHICTVFIVLTLLFVLFYSCLFVFNIGQYDDAVMYHKKYRDNAQERDDVGGVAIMQREIAMDYMFQEVKHRASLFYLFISYSSYNTSIKIEEGLCMWASWVVSTMGRICSGRDVFVGVEHNLVC